MEIPSLVPVPLKRTGRAIDRIIALPIEHIGDRIERKLRDNLDSHVTAVEKSRDARKKKKKIEESELSVNKLSALSDWSHGAAQIDPQDSTLSAAWRAVLDRLMEDDDESSDLLRAVEGLPKNTLRFLLGTRGRPMFFSSILRSHGAEAHLQKLHQAGIIEPQLNWRKIAPVLVLSLLICVAMFLVLPRLGIAVTDKVQDATVVASMLLATTLVMVFVISLNWRLSRFGADFVRRFDLYLSELADASKTGPDVDGVGDVSPMPDNQSESNSVSDAQSGRTQKGRRNKNQDRASSDRD